MCRAQIKFADLRGSVSRILSAEALPKGIQMEDRFVDVGVFPIGIDVRALTEKRYVCVRRFLRARVHLQSTGVILKSQNGSKYSDSATLA